LEDRDKSQVRLLNMGHGSFLRESADGESEVIRAGRAASNELRKGGSLEQMLVWQDCNFQYQKLENIFPVCFLAVGVDKSEVES
jgi:hypothetical protein